jgi:hypothetical protein
VTAYRWAFKGEKQAREVEPSPAGTATRTFTVYDGAKEQFINAPKSGSLENAQAMIGSKSALRQTLSPLWGSYKVVSWWISDLLRDPAYALRDGPISQKFGPTVLLVGSPNTPFNGSVMLAPSLGYLGIGYDKLQKNGLMVSAVRVLAFSKQDGVLLPTMVTSNLHPLNSSATDRSYVRTMTAHYSNLNGVGDGRFEFKSLPKGSNEVDADTGRVYYVGDLGRRIPINLKRDRGQMIVGWTVTVGSMLLVIGLAYGLLRRLIPKRSG